MDVPQKHCVVFGTNPIVLVQVAIVKHWLEVDKDELQY